MKLNLFPLTRHKNTLQFLPLPKALLLYKFHFSYDLIYWNEIPDIRQKVMESVIKYWNHIQTFAFVIFWPKTSNNDWPVSRIHNINSLASAQILRIPWRRKVQAVDTRTVFIKRNFMQIFTHETIHSNTWSFVVPSFFDNWQFVYFSYRFELTSH